MKNDPSLKDISKQISLIYGQIGLIIEVGATKEDLKNFATKEDLKKFATKEDLVALKTELKTEIGKARDVALTHADIKVLEAVVESAKNINLYKNQDKKFKQNLVSVMRNNKLATVVQLKKLRQTI